ncbi:Chaperone DnaJ-domain superfamily protein, putative isoform 1 [Hibiscus syriacus]|uniref:Chaperone DnaJ-domain superfamily protein, putative isoform 1 n=1 Tax=Hibiscus syriacus TaxID=106335 RepID=A0A6A3A3C5_HIBSY|nr:Chaperone DnaJ-domain superfamily protein, putative isoform 1 [Hibiscus syriacus]
MDGNTTEAERWLSIAEKLLATRDLHGTRTFAIRARESAPILADQILAVTDTLLTAQSNPQDWYGILQLVPLTQSMEVVASQYRKLALLLNPGRNRLSFADQAFRFVSEAWNVLSNPSKKAIYDNESRFLQYGQVSQPGQQQQPQLQQQKQHQPQTHTLFMQSQTPPAPKETQTLFMQTPQKETPTQVTQPLFTRRSPRDTDRDGNADLGGGGGQLGLNNKPPEQNRSAEPIWRRQMNQIGLGGTSQLRQSGSVDSSQINQLEPTQIDQVSRPEPICMSQINQTGTDSSSQFNRAEPARTGQINQTTPPLPPRENCQTQSTSVTQPREATEPERLTFWTACPYCYVLYEYPKLYEDCSLRCQTKNCRRAFHAVVIPSPPVNGKDTHFSCWGFFPLGYSRGGNFPSWSPISTMFACPNNQNAGKQNTAKKSAPRVYYDDDDDLYVDISDSIGTSDDDDDWQNEKRKKVKNAKGKGVSICASTAPDGVPTAESSRRVVNSGRKQMGRVAKNLGKLDLNVEFSNEVEEPALKRNEGNHAGYGRRITLKEWVL